MTEPAAAVAVAVVAAAVLLLADLLNTLVGTIFLAEADATALLAVEDADADAVAVGGRGMASVSPSNGATVSDSAGTSGGTTGTCPADESSMVADLCFEDDDDDEAGSWSS